MKVLGYNLLVEPIMAGGALRAKTNVGKVIHVGDWIEEGRINQNDEIVFGDDFEEVDLKNSEGKTVRFYLMSLKNVKFIQ